MDWQKKIDKGINQSIDVSKKILEGAKKKAKKIGDQSVLAFEIKELEKEHAKLLSDMGEAVYALFIDSGRSSVTARTPEIKPLLSRLQQVKEKLAEKKSYLEKE